MTTDRPMSEYESALFDAVVILGHAVIRLGANETEILTELREAQQDAARDNRRNRAATLDMLIKILCEPPVYYVPREPGSN
jgi:hypothetical protein